MTPINLARLECIKFLSDGTCPRDKVETRDGVIHFAPYPRCNLASGKPCKHFEEIVLPILEMTTDKRRERELTEAKEQYKEMKNEYERTAGRHTMERTQNDDIAGLREKTASALDLGGRPSGDPTGAGSLRLQGPGGLELDRITESGLSLGRI
jgi:hypothetical protein